MENHLIIPIMLGAIMAVAFGPAVWEKMTDAFKKLWKGKDRRT